MIRIDLSVNSTTARTRPVSEAIQYDKVAEVNETGKYRPCLGLPHEEGDHTEDKCTYGDPLLFSHAQSIERAPGMDKQKPADKTAMYMQPASL
jgi:hypothetical protein